MNKTTKIGFDLDKVLVNYPPLVPDGLIDYLYRDHQKKELSYRIPNSYTERVIRRMTHFFLLRPPIKKNILFLKNLSQSPNNYQIYLISSRYKFLEKITYRILKRYQILDKFKKIYLNTLDQQPHLFKEKIIKYLELDIYIDDDLDLLKYLASKLKKTKLFWYNPKKIRSREIISPVIVVAELNEILPYLKK